MEKEKKVVVSKIKYDKEGRYIFLRVALGSEPVLHEAIGILEDVKVDIMSMVRGPRMAIARQIQMKEQAEKLAKAHKLNELRGNGVVKGLKNNPKIIE